MNRRYNKAATLFLIQLLIYIGCVIFAKINGALSFADLEDYGWIYLAGTIITQTLIVIFLYMKNNAGVLIASIFYAAAGIFYFAEGFLPYFSYFDVLTKATRTALVLGTMYYVLSAASVLIMGLSVIFNTKAQHVMGFSALSVVFAITGQLPMTLYNLYNAIDAAADIKKLYGNYTSFISIYGKTVSYAVCYAFMFLGAVIYISAIARASGCFNVKEDTYNGYGGYDSRGNYENYGSYGNYGNYGNTGSYNAGQDNNGEDIMTGSYDTHQNK